MDFLHPGKDFKDGNIDFGAGTDRAQHGLARTGRAMHLEAHLYQVVDDCLDLILGRNVLHGYDHKKAARAAGSWRVLFCSVIFARLKNEPIMAKGSGRFVTS